ncbi:acylneuraminate cytidylyltransferase family protein [Candidatus Babeliales bacterium]|nr:acylneuraminate cytidylyltransferase family protein [Candidatus Babeliales bacterium]
MKQKFVAFIPVRGGSKSIRFKNIKPLAGKPLVFWTIESALQASIIQSVYVATDSDIISKCVSEHFNSKKLFVIGRDPKTATDLASSESVLLEFCKNYVFDYVFFIQATSPLLSSDDLNNAWNYYKDTNFDSLLSVVRQKRFLWQTRNNGQAYPLNYDPRKRPRRQEFDGFLIENGAFYLSSRDNILLSNCRISGKIGVYEMNENSYYEIDEKEDWLVVEQIIKNFIGVKNEVK